MPDMIRIANAGGYWGDDLAQFQRQVELGPGGLRDARLPGRDHDVDHAEAARARPARRLRARLHRPGRARRCRCWSSAASRVITNAGGVNPLACRGALLEMAQLARPAARGRGGGRRRPDGAARRAERRAASRSTTWTTAPRSPRSATASRRPTPTTAPGRWSRRCASGAQIVVTGRCTDTGITLAPMIHAFGWAADDWDRLARRHRRRATSSSAARRAPAATSPTGGAITRFETIGYPVIEVLARRLVRRHQARRHRRRGHGAHGEGAAGLRDGRPARLHHARRGRRLRAPSGSSRPGATACACGA